MHTRVCDFDEQARRDAPRRPPHRRAALVAAVGHRVVGAVLNKVARLAAAVADVAVGWRAALRLAVGAKGHGRSLDAPRRRPAAAAATAAGCGVALVVGPRPLITRGGHHLLDLQTKYAAGAAQHSVSYTHRLSVCVCK